MNLRIVFQLINIPPFTKEKLVVLFKKCHLNDDYVCWSNDLQQLAKN